MRRKAIDEAVLEKEVDGPGSVYIVARLGHGWSLVRFIQPHFQPWPASHNSREGAGSIDSDGPAPPSESTGLQASGTLPDGMLN